MSPIPVRAGGGGTETPTAVEGSPMAVEVLADSSLDYHATPFLSVLDGSVTLPDLAGNRCAPPCALAGLVLLYRGADPCRPRRVCGSDDEITRTCQRITPNTHVEFRRTEGHTHTAVHDRPSTPTSMVLSDSTCHFLPHARCLARAPSQCSESGLSLPLYDLSHLGVSDEACVRLVGLPHNYTELYGMLRDDYWLVPGQEPQGESHGS